MDASYFEADENFRLRSIQSGPQANLPAFFYSGYDDAGNLTGVSFWDSTYTYTYDDLNRLASVSGSLNHTYTYDRLGNIEAVVKGGVTWDYVYQKDDTLAHKPYRLTGVSGLNFSASLTTGYDSRGNLIQYKQGATTYSLTFDVEGRLTGVKTEATGQPTREASFSYDADGNRVLAVYKTSGTETSRTYPGTADGHEPKRDRPGLHRAQAEQHRNLQPGSHLHERQVLSSAVGAVC
jgi:YD repeat-containing protein